VREAERAIALTEAMHRIAATPAGARLTLHELEREAEGELALESLSARCADTETLLAAS
jgi:hypothetical protein